MPEQVQTLRRTPLSRERILRAAVALADEAGIESLSMRNLAQDLGVVPMALYKHVANKDELLDGMIDVVVGEIDPGARHRLEAVGAPAHPLGAAGAAAPPWAPLAIESRTMATPAILAYLDSVVATLRAGGFSTDLAHHVMHAMGSRILGFSQELFDPSRQAGRSGATNPIRRRPCRRRSRPGSRTWRRSPRRPPTTATLSWGRAATTSSSSSSRWTCCWTASNGCSGRAGPRRGGPTARTRTRHRNAGGRPGRPIRATGEAAAR